jgi:hypothetical protein
LKREGDFFICRRIRTNLWPKCITTEAVYAWWGNARNGGRVNAMIHGARHYTIWCYVDEAQSWISFILKYTTASLKCPKKRKHTHLDCSLTPSGKHVCHTFFLDTQKPNRSSFPAPNFRFGI